MMWFVLIIIVQSVLLLYLLYLIPSTKLGFTEVLIRLYDIHGMPVVKQKCWAAYEMFLTDGCMEIKTAKIYYNVTKDTMVPRSTIALMEFPDIEADMPGIFFLKKGDGSILYMPQEGASCILRLS